LPVSQAMHVLTKVAPVAVEYVPALQSVHAAEPDKGLYLPAAHETQLCASSPVWPAGHCDVATCAREHMHIKNNKRLDDMRGRRRPRGFMTDLV